MNILLIGGTRYFGLYTIRQLLSDNHNVTIATRGKTPDSFGPTIKRICIERTNPESLRCAFREMHYDVVIDKLAYCSNDIRSAMETIDCDHYIHMSSTAVYEPKHWNTVEADFDAAAKPVIWCDRGTFPYDESKRHAERALQQEYPDRSWLCVRYPFVVDEADYTGRLQFYVEHTIKGIPMYIDNPDAQLGFIRADEAGQFMAFLAGKKLTGAINGCSSGTISPKEIIAYVEQQTGTKAVLHPSGEPAPYNGEPSYSINTELAAGLGYSFTPLHTWIYQLLDYYIHSLP